MNELTLNPTEVQSGIRYRVGSIAFDDFQENLRRAEIIAESIGAMEPTEENIAEAKKKIAAARKVTDGINKLRISIKKQMLLPYDDFESQVKQITEVITQAESIVREKINLLEEEQREQRRQTLKDIWKSRAEWYGVIKANPEAFDLWLEPRHLNKTASLKSVEAEMTAWLEKKSSEFDTAIDMGPDYETAFLQTFDLQQAIDRVNKTNTVKAALRDAQGEERVEIAAFHIEGAKDIQLTEMLLEKNHIRYFKEEL